MRRERRRSWRRRGRRGIGLRMSGAKVETREEEEFTTEGAEKRMTVITIEQAGKYDGQEVTIRGWLYNLRESGKLVFPIFRDGTGIIQGVCALKENPAAFAALKGLTQESSVIVTGKIRAEQRAPGGYEMGISKIDIVQKVSDSTPYPIQLKE